MFFALANELQHGCGAFRAKCLVHPCWLINHLAGSMAGSMWCRPYYAKKNAATMTTAISLQEVIGSVRHFHHCCVDKKDLSVLLYLAL